MPFFDKYCFACWEEEGENLSTENRKGKTNQTNRTATVVNLNGKYLDNQIKDEQLENRF